MTLISEILNLDLQEDLKHVIDIQDQSEIEIQSEIESYIVTEGIGVHFSAFANKFTSNIKETGVWISGFYGSGKSYFGKMLGYIIENPEINGTPAKDRFIPRLKGISNESLIENDLRKFDTVKSRVIFLDIAKQNTENGLPFTLFCNFLKKLGFRDDLYGYMEYDLYIFDKYDEFKKQSLKLFNTGWDELKKSNKEVARAFRRIYTSDAMGYTEVEYEETKDVYSAAINNFSSSKFKEELEKYLNKFQDETIVFIFDEASEAISQKKYNLLDLEGLSEALSSISNKVWLIAIAQEKLDDVINNANVNKSQLTKVIDRFKTKIHLDSTEVDIIIKSRLLQKKETYFKKLVGYFEKNDGLIADATNLKSVFPTKTEVAEEFAVYYPFHKYQFDLLQKFLFSSNALVANQIAARGMISTTFDVLREHLKNKSVYNFATAAQLCTEGQQDPPYGLGIKYDNADKILKNTGSDVNGEALLKTIHFLSESELVLTTVENITKTYLEDLNKYYEFKPKIEEALESLVESKILLLTNNNYKITSDLEGKLLEEMKDFDVPLYIKKRDLVKYLKTTTLFRNAAGISEDSVQYSFNILTDLDDEIIGSLNKNLKLTVYSLFNITENRQDFIESLKLDTQSAKDTISLVPDNHRFDEIDKLMGEVTQLLYMEEKYENDDDPNTRQIIREFALMKAEKEKDLLNLIKGAYQIGSLIYLFDEYLLNGDKFKGTINDVQRKLIKNIYTKRLKAQLSEKIASQLLNEQNNDKLHRYFSGDDFKFFDSKGNFTGEHLKIIEEIASKTNKRYIDGKSLETELSGVPWGYSYGTINTTLAVLFRAGRLVLKHNGIEYFSFKDKPAHEVFSSGRKFKNASFKSITKKLTAIQKNKIVQTLLDLNYAEHTDQKVDWSTNDFELADAAKILAEHFINSINTLGKTVNDFNKLFGNVEMQKTVLQNYSSKTTEANYIEKAEYFISTIDDYTEAINTIVKAEKFVRKNLDKVKGFKRFVDGAVTELGKAGQTNKVINNNQIEFEKLFKEDIVADFPELQQKAQSVKDEYFKLMKDAAGVMTEKHKGLKAQIENVQKNVEKNYPEELNRSNILRLKTLHAYCTSRIVEDVKLEYHIQCQNCNYSLSEICNYIELLPSKESELIIIQSNFIKVAPKPEESDKPKAPKKIQFTVSKKVMTAKEYRNLLSGQLKALAGMDNDDEIELNIEQK